MNDSLKEQLLNVGFSESPTKKKKPGNSSPSQGQWKNEVRRRLSLADNMLIELQSVLRDTHKHFQDGLPKKKLGKGPL